MAIQILIIDPDAVPTGEQIRDALLALNDEDRALIITNPATADFKVVQIDGTLSGQKVKVKLSYDDVPVP